MSITYKIHPAIGIARVGPGSDPYDAPTVMGGMPGDGNESFEFRDTSGQLRPQSAVFQVYRYDSEIPGDEGSPVEIGNGGVSEINWTAWLANKKSAWFKFAGPNGENGGYPSKHPLRNMDVKGDERRMLVLDPGPKTVSSTAAGSANFDLDRSDLAALKPFPVVSLGSMQASAAGQLRITAAAGNAGSASGEMPSGGPNDFANNDGWFDEIADGPVSATLTVDGKEVEVDVPAWVVCAPPKFAPQIVNLVTLRDAIYDVAIREQNYNPALWKDGEFQETYTPNFASEIEPILKRPDLYQYVAKLPPSAVAGHKQLPGGPAEFVFSLIRSPDEPNKKENEDGITLMPFLAGDNPFYPPPAKPAIFLTLTRTQYFLLEQWSKGIVNHDAAPPVPKSRGLDWGVLENCVGGPFVPGIEITWVLRKTEIYSEPFRIKHKEGLTQGELFQPKQNTAYTFEQLFGDGVEPGDLSAFMALPWQSDYNLCSSQGGPKNPAFGVELPFVLWWWAAQRPDWVKKQGSLEQVTWISSSNPDGGDNINFDSPVSMVKNWMDLGFVVKEDDAYVLVQTNPGDQE